MKLEEAIAHMLIARIGEYLKVTMFKDAENWSAFHTKINMRNTETLHLH